MQDIYSITDKRFQGWGILICSKFLPILDKEERYLFKLLPRYIEEHFLTFFRAL